MCVRCAAHPALSLSLYSSFSFPTGDSPMRAFVHIRGCLLDERRKERERGWRGRERLFCCAFPRDAAPDRKSGSHALCLFILVPFWGTHGLSLRPTGPSLPPVPASGPRRRDDDVFLLVEHASWSFSLPVPSLVRFLVFFPLLRCLRHSCFLSCFYS